MNKPDAIKWLESLKSEIGRSSQELSHFEQPLYEIIKMLENEVPKCATCEYYFELNGTGTFGCTKVREIDGSNSTDFPMPCEYWEKWQPSRF